MLKQFLRIVLAIVVIPGTALAGKLTITATKGDVIGGTNDRATVQVNVSAAGFFCFFTSGLLDPFVNNENFTHYNPGAYTFTMGASGTGSNKAETFSGGEYNPQSESCNDVAVESSTGITVKPVSFSLSLGTTSLETGDVVSGTVQLNAFPREGHQFIFYIAVPENGVAQVSSQSQPAGKG